MPETHTPSKSPFILLLLLGFLAIATSVAISNYFIRPGLEAELKQRITSTLEKQRLEKVSVIISGRDVIIGGNTDDKLQASIIKKAIEKIEGVRHVESKIVVNNQTIE